jgi:hypothetical protein
MCTPLKYFWMSEPIFIKFGVYISWRLSASQRGTSEIPFIINTNTRNFQAVLLILWRVRVLETPFGLLLRFIYDFTSRHYNYFYNETRTRLTAYSLPGWFLVLRCLSDLTSRFCSACLVPLSWRFVSDRLLWPALILNAHRSEIVWILYM